MHAHGRLLAAADRHQTDAGKLRDFLGQSGVGQILHLLQRYGLGTQRQSKNRRVGGIHFVVDRRIGEVGGKKSAAGIDGRLHLLLGDVNVLIKIKLQNDQRSAEGAGRGHLLQARHLAELPLQRSGHGRDR